MGYRRKHQPVLNLRYIQTNLHEAAGVRGEKKKEKKIHEHLCPHSSQIEENVGKGIEHRALIDGMSCRALISNGEASRWAFMRRKL